jgi:hypothetical protein
MGYNVRNNSPLSAPQGIDGEIRDDGSSQKEPTSSKIPLDPVEAGYEEEIIKLRAKVAQKFFNFVGNVQTGETPDPFTITTTETKDKRLWLPSNIDSLVENNALVGSIVHLWSVGGGLLRKCDKALPIEKLTSKDSQFWKAFLKELMREEAPEALKFKISSDAERGTTCARLEILKHYLKGNNQMALFRFISEHCYAKDVAGPDTEWLSVYLNSGLGGLQSNIKRSVGSVFKSIISDIAGFRYSRFKAVAESYKAPMSLVMEGLHRTKEVGAGAKKRKVTVHPNRPSERAGVLFEWEDRFLKANEKAFDRLKERMESIQKQSGVLLLEIPKFRADVKRDIEECWTSMQKYARILTSREKALAALVKEYGVGNGKATPENFKTFITTLASIRLAGTDVTSVCQRIHLFSLMRDNVSLVSEKVTVDSIRIVQNAATLYINHQNAPGDSTIWDMLGEIATLMSAFPRVVTIANQEQPGFGYNRYRPFAPSGADSDQESDH